MWVFFPTVSWLFACKHTCKPLFPALRRVIVRSRIASLSRNGCCCVHTYVKRYSHMFHIYIFIVLWRRKHELSGDISLYFMRNTFEKRIDIHWRKFNVPLQLVPLISAPPLYTYKPCNKILQIICVASHVLPKLLQVLPITTDVVFFFFFLLYLFFG